MSEMWLGIDVSDNQGIIDWMKVKAAGVKFAILRSVRRSGKADCQFANNLTGCRANGIPVDVYKYTYAQTVEQAREEARQVVALLQKHGLKNTMVWWDVEDRAALASLGWEPLAECIEAARAVIKAAGYRFGIYTGLYVYREKWFDFNRFAAVPLWIARYYKGNTVIPFGEVPDQNSCPNLGRAIWGWQHTSSGRVDGIAGDVDLNVCYQDPAEAEVPEEEPDTFWTCSIADVGSEVVAKAVATAYPGCLVHKVSVLDVGGAVIWIASVADVWTRAQAEAVQKQLADIGIAGLVHKVKIVE